MRLKRALLIGAMAGTSAVAIVATSVSLVRGLAVFAAQPVLLVFSIGFLAGFILRLQWPDFAPPARKDDGDAEAGVPALLIPPVPRLSARIAPEADAENA